MSPRSESRDALDRIKDEVWAELLACYGEGEDTDWPYLTDLCDVIVGLIDKHAQAVIDARFAAVLGPHSGSNGGQDA